MNAVLSAVFLSLTVLVGPSARAQDAPAAPAAEPSDSAPAPPQAAPPTADPSALGAIPDPGPGTATGPPPLGNEAGVEPPQAQPDASQAAPRASTATFPTGGSSDDGPYLYIGLGAGLLVLVGLAVLWTRGRPTDSAELPEGIALLPSPPFLAAPVPALSDGVQVWVAAEEHQEDLLKGVLTTLADAHRVLVVAPSSVALPAVGGGPVYRVDGTRPVHLEEPVAIMAEDGGRTPVVVLVLPGEHAGAAPDFADVLPPGIGAIALVESAAMHGFPVVEAVPEGSGWRLQRGNVSTVVTPAWDGQLRAQSPREAV